MPYSVAGRLWEICCINDIFPATRAERSKPVQLECGTSGEWDLYPATQAAKASFTAFLHHFRSQATKRTRRRTPWVSELSSRLLKSLLYEDLSSKTMSAAGDLSAAAQHLPDVERRRCWSILEAGFLSLIPSPYAKRPEKRWLCTRRSSFCWEKRVAVEALLLVMAPFRTEAVLTVLHRNDPPWPRLDSVYVVSSSPPRATRNGLARSSTIRSLKVEWTSHAHAMKDARDRSRKRARTQWARMPLILKRNLKLLGGFIGNGEPPCVRACSPDSPVGLIT